MMKHRSGGSLFLLGLAALAFSALVRVPCGNALADSQAPGLPARVKALESKVEDLEGAESRVAELESLLMHFSRDGDDVYLDGANLHVRNGTGSTGGTPNALGNVIIGYNELRGAGDDDRSGSHMLVVGRRLNYSSFGGIVAGLLSETSDEFASVTGGYNNMASGPYATVSGGGSNVASGNYASVTGGAANEASGYAATVSGGSTRTASGTTDWVAGSLFEDE